uniref:Uncharacterized protein n=1 Tax=Plectus sambesii TaxID=2011161 RepID=A0A914W0H4_9BILA
MFAHRRRRLVGGWRAGPSVFVVVAGNARHSRHPRDHRSTFPQLTGRSSGASHVLKAERRASLSASSSFRPPAAAPTPVLPPPPSTLSSSLLRVRFPPAARHSLPSSSFLPQPLHWSPARAIAAGFFRAVRRRTGPPATAAVTCFGAFTRRADPSASTLQSVRRCCALPACLRVCRVGRELHRKTVIDSSNGLASAAPVAANGADRRRRNRREQNAALRGPIATVARAQIAFRDLPSSFFVHFASREKWISLATPSDFRRTTSARPPLGASPASPGPVARVGGRCCSAVIANLLSPTEPVRGCVVERVTA